MFPPKQIKERKRELQSLNITLSTAITFGPVDVYKRRKMENDQLGQTLILGKDQLLFYNHC